MAGELVKLLPLRASPGIKRDGTIMEGTYWTDGEWSRMYRGLPRSIGGYRSLSENYHGPSRGMYMNALNGLLNVFSGYNNGIEVAQFTKAGSGSTPSSRTPAGFATSANNVWQIDSMFTSTGSGYTALLAHAGQNLTAIDSNVATPVYYGDISTTAALVATGSPAVSGGVVYMAPFAVTYGSQGQINVSNAADPTTFLLTRQYNVCADKIVKMMPIRGGAYAPSALIWSLGSLLRMSFVGGDAIWQFDTLSTDSSVLSSSAMIEADGVYYWPGVDRFLMYNGVLQEAVNNISLDFFYENLNTTYQQKVFATKIPRWGEIWFCFPAGTATECNWVLIYNYREKCWYDSPLPVDGRCAAIAPTTTFPFPIMASAIGLQSQTVVGQTNYPLWQHEFGTDLVRGNQTLAIRSSITSPSMSLVGGGLVLGGVSMPADSVWTQVVRFEPDFLKNSALELNLLTRELPEDADEIIPLTMDTTIEDVDKQARYWRYQIVSNSTGNRYALGQSLIHFRPGDRQP